MKVRFVRHQKDDVVLSDASFCDYDRLYGVSTEYPEGFPEKGWGRFIIEQGYESTVYAIRVHGTTMTYYIRDPKGPTVTHFPAFSFDVIDNRMSRHWCIKKDIITAKHSIF